MRETGDSCKLCSELRKRPMTVVIYFELTKRQMTDEGDADEEFITELKERDR